MPLRRCKSSIVRLLRPLGTTSKSRAGLNCSKLLRNGFTSSSSNVKPCSFRVTGSSSQITKSRTRGERGWDQGGGSERRICFRVNEEFPKEYETVIADYFKKLSYAE